MMCWPQRAGLTAVLQSRTLQRHRPVVRDFLGVSCPCSEARCGARAHCRRLGALTQCHGVVWCGRLVGRVGYPTLEPEGMGTCKPVACTLVVTCCQRAPVNL